MSRFCGETEIRTRETLWESTRFPGVPLKPLEHLSWADFPAAGTVPGEQDCKYRNIPEY